MHLFSVFVCKSMCVTHSKRLIVYVQVLAYEILKAKYSNGWTSMRCTSIEYGI